MLKRKNRGLQCGDRKENARRKITRKREKRSAVQCSVDTVYVSADA